jgi:lysostaphin
MQSVSLSLSGATRRVLLLLLLLLLNTFSCLLFGLLPTAADAPVSPFAGDRNSYSVKVEPRTVKQGQTLVVQLESKGRFNPQEPPPAVTFDGEKYKVFPIDTPPVSDNSSGDATTGEARNFRALIGIHALKKPGSYKITVAQGETVPITVVAGGYGMQRLRLPPGKDNFISSPGEEETVEKARATVSGEKHWQGLFQKPSVARVSAGYGLRRIVNGKLLDDYFHSGVDYAGSLGSPVKATQRGKVIIAKNGWRLHGNTIAIDHGQGVISFYIHLSKVLVEEGQMVNSGDLIGKIGATGRASGPHLHFSIYINGNATNPLPWYVREYI